MWEVNTIGELHRCTIKFALFIGRGINILYKIGYLLAIARTDIAGQNLSLGNKIALGIEKGRQGMMTTQSLSKNKLI